MDRTGIPEKEVPNARERLNPAGMEAGSLAPRGISLAAENPRDQWSRLHRKMDRQAEFASGLARRGGRKAKHDRLARATRLGFLRRI